MAQAGAMGVPFVSVRGLIGSDVLNHHPRMKVIHNPFNPTEEVVVAEAIRPEVGVFHALKADRFGNCVVPARREDGLVAQACRLTVFTAEELVEDPLGPGDAPGATFIPATHVDAVVHAPYGAHPGGYGAVYPTDDLHMQEYVQAANNDESFQEYLDRYVYGLPDHEAYLARVGLRLP